MAHLVKNLPTMRETWVRPLVWEDLLEKGKAAAAAAKLLQSCTTLCNPMDDTAHGILQARILERIAFAFSRESSQPRDQTQVSHIAGRFFTS